MTREELIDALVEAVTRKPASEKIYSSKGHAMAQKLHRLKGGRQHAYYSSVGGRVRLRRDPTVVRRDTKAMHYSKSTGVFSDRSAWPSRPARALSSETPRLATHAKSMRPKGKKWADRFMNKPGPHRQKVNLARHQRETAKNSPSWVDWVATDSHGGDDIPF